METQLKIPIPGKKYVYGTLQGSLKKPLIIFVHGFTGYKDEHVFFNGARFFEEKGFSSFRFNLYDWRKDARKLEECTLSLHGEDLDRVVSYLRQRGTKQLFTIGHSFGGLTVLLSKQKDFEASVLWDPSDNPVIFTGPKYTKYIQELDRYYCDNFAAFGFTIGEAMFKENKKLKPFKLIKEFKTPVKIIVAGKGMLIKGGQKYFKLANNPKDFAIIDNAGHTFDEEGTEETLFEETLKWLRRW